MPSRATKKTNASASPNKKSEKPEKTDKAEKHEEETKSGHKRQREPSQDQVYFVEAILDKKRFYGVWRYKVKWQGFPEEECTWEPAKNLESVKNMIAEFNKTFVPPKEEEEDKEKEKAAPKTATKEKAAKSKTTKPKEKEKEKEKDKENDNDKMKKFEKKTKMGSPKKKVKTDKPQEIIKVDCGHFKLGDHAKQITNAKKENNQVLFTIEWKAREDGKAPGNTKMSNEEIRKYDKDLLLDFYEARLKFVKPPVKASEAKSANKSDHKEPMEEEHESKHSSPHGKESDKATNEENESEVNENGTLENQEKGQEEGDKDKNQESEKSVISEENKPENQPGETVLGGKENLVEDVENEIDDNDQPIYADISFQVAEEMRVEAYAPEYTKSAGGEKKAELDVPKQDLQLASPQEISDGEEGNNNDADNE